MGAFGDPWGDIDRTKKNTPYIVDESGWGWFLLGIIALVPVVIAVFFLQNIAVFITENPIISGILYVCIVVLIGEGTYIRKGIKKRFWGIVATFFTFTPFALIEIFFEIPMILTNSKTIISMISLVLEWFFVTLFTLGISIFIQAINLLNVSIRRHLITAIIYLIVVILIIIRTVSAENLEVIRTLYT